MRCKLNDTKSNSTCAVVGENAYNRAHPNFPITPQQIADSALEVERAGASLVHLYVRNPKTGEDSRDPSLFLDVDDPRHGVIHALEAWIEEGSLPSEIIATKYGELILEKGVAFTLTLCAYPKVRLYRGVIGLPQTELMTGLLFFNLGVEIGQVIFAAAALGTIAALRYLLRRVLAQRDSAAALQRFSAYGIGSLASFWLIERCAGFFV